MKTIGIIGYGSFGHFLAEKLEPYAKVIISSRNPASVPEQWRASLEEVATCDYLIPGIPLDSYESVFSQIADIIPVSTIVIDVCSVKVKPLQILRRLLPRAQIVATHPLFGPQSAAETVKGHTFVICPDVSDPQPLKVVEDFAHKLEMHVVKVTAEEHDKEMAVVHGLTFFVARTLVKSEIHKMKLHTPSFKRLLSLAELEEHHSDELFMTIQRGNDQTAAIRHAFLHNAENLNTEIEEYSDT